MKLIDRIKALETGRLSGIEETNVRGGFDFPEECAAASPTPSLEWFAAPDEIDAKGRTTTAFKERVRAEARAAGAKDLLWFGPGYAA